MTPNPPVDPKLQEFLDAEADAYLESLPLSHFMESTTQSTQRKITLASFDQVRTVRPEVQCFSELLIQYRRKGRKHTGKVVPDNFVLLHLTPLDRLKSFNYHTQTARPLLVLEYVSKENMRKDYEDNFDRYERHLKIPYYLLFYPDNDELSLFRMDDDGEYASVPPNDAGRVAIPELELEAALLGGWVRFWFRGELLPLTGDLMIERDAAREQRDDAAQQRDEAAQQRDEAKKQRDEAKKQRDEAKKQRDEAKKQFDSERQARLAVEAELARLREELARVSGNR